MGKIKVDISSMLTGDKAKDEIVRDFCQTLVKQVNSTNYACSIFQVGMKPELNIQGGKIEINFNSVKKKVQNVEEFHKRWVERHYAEFMADPNADLADDSEKSITISIKRSRFKRSLYTSFCNKTDSFDYETGIAVAYARSRGEKIPSYI